MSLCLRRSVVHQAIFAATMERYGSVTGLLSEGGVGKQLFLVGSRLPAFEEGQFIHPWILPYRYASSTLARLFESPCNHPPTPRTPRCPARLGARRGRGVFREGNECHSCRRKLQLPLGGRIHGRILAPRGGGDQT